MKVYVNVKARLTLLLTLLLAAFIAVNLYVSIDIIKDRTYGIMEISNKNLSQLIISNFQNRGMSQELFGELYRFTGNAYVKDIYLLDNSGKVHFATNPAVSSGSFHAGFAEMLQNVKHRMITETQFITLYPFVYGEKREGYMAIESSLASFQVQIKKETNFALFLSAIYILVGWLAAYLIARYIAKPIDAYLSNTTYYRPADLTHKEAQEELESLELDEEEAEPEVLLRTEEKVQVDLQMHLIPGLNDGPEDLDQAVAMLRVLERLGYKRVVTMPHIASHKFMNTKRTIETGLKVLQQELTSQDVRVTVEAASQYQLDKELFDALGTEALMTFGDNYLLLQLPIMSEPEDLIALFEHIVQQGYKPVLAHPERYFYLFGGDEAERYRELKEQGVYFMVSMLSLAGFYSQQVKDRARQLVEAGVIDFIASDVHNAKQLAVFEEILKSGAYRYILDHNRLLNNSV